jgi:hypothetical protein
MAVYRSDQAQLTFGPESAPGAYPGMATTVVTGTGDSTLASAHNAGSHKITVASTTGITAGEDVKIGGASNTESEVRRVEFVEGAVLFLDAPTAHYHASSSAVQVVTSITTTANEVYMNQIPGVYDTVEVPDMTPTLEPRYFLGTQSKRDFFAVYKGQQAFTGSVSGFVLLNGRALRYPFGKVVTKASTSSAGTYLTAEARKGDVFITVAAITGPTLAVGGLIAIDEAASPVATSVSEVRKIVAISTLTLQLDYPLTYAHAAAGSGTTQIKTVAATGITYDHHIFEQVDLDTVSWHVHMRDSGETTANDFDRTYFGGMIGSATLAADEGGMLNMSWDGVNFQGFKHNQMLGNSSSSSAIVPHAGVMQSITAANVDFPTSNPYFFSQGSVTMFGVEVARVRSFSLGVSNGEEPRYYIQRRQGNKRGPTEIREQRRDYTLGVTLALPDSQAAAGSSGNTIFKEFLTEGDFGSGMQGFNIVLSFTRGTNDSITITIPDDGTAATGGNQQGAFFRSAPHGITGDNPVQVDADILVRNAKILVTDSLYYYP